MKNNIFVIAAIIVMLIFVSGESGCQKETKVTFNAASLISSFVDNAPPKEMITGQKYPIYVDVANAGGYDVAPGQANFYLSGIGDNLKNVNTHVTNANLLTKKTSMQDGGKERVTFATQAEPGQNLQSAFNFIVRMDSCYKYATITQTNICIGQGNSLCNVSSEKITNTSNSAAPLQITSMTEQVIGNKLYVYFLIENKGIGQVFLPTSDCNKLQEQDINEKLKQNKVEINVRISETDMTCTIQSAQPPYGAIESAGGAVDVGRVTCQKILTGTETHTSPIEIVLSYIYKDGITKSITIFPA